jgi:uncharacterized membrane protein YtjA (UPF0391 family)
MRVGTGGAQRFESTGESARATPGTGRANTGRHGAASCRSDSNGRKIMLHYAIVFFVIALIAAVFGFGGIAAGAVEIGKILFFVFLVIAAITFVMSLLRKR